MVEKVYKIKDVFNLFAGGDVNHSHCSDYKTSAYIFCVYSNSLADHGLYGYTDVPKYSGDSITITGRGSIGHAEYRPFDFDAIIRLLVLIPKYKDIIDSRYVTELINSYVKFPLESTGVPQLTVPQIENIEISLPTIEVQRKIANALSDMDSMISLLEKLIAKYKSIKAACLQQMFPQNGETVPRMRLPGFTDDWEQRKLSELTSMHARIGWQNLRTSEFLNSGDYMLITGTDFNDGAINFSTCHYVERERYEQDRNIQIHNGSILITKDGTLGKVAYVQGLSKPATLNAGVFNVQIKDANIVDEKYLFQYLKAPFLMDYVDKKATGGTIKHLNQSILVDFPVILPQRSEQILIGAFFQQLDNLITLHQRKLEKVQKIKQGMMQQLLTGKIRLV